MNGGPCNISGFFTVVPCGGLLTEPSGEISSPGYPGPYPSNLACEWIIQGAPGDIIELQFLDFEIEGNRKSRNGRRNGRNRRRKERSLTCLYDFVSIYDGSSTDSPLIGTYCGNVAPTNILSTGNELLITFTTDDSTALSGFSASFRHGF